MNRELSDRFEKEVYNFLERKAMEYPELDYLNVYNALQAVAFRLLNELEAKSQASRFAEIMGRISRKDERNQI